MGNEMQTPARLWPTSFPAIFWGGPVQGSMATEPGSHLGTETLYPLGSLIWRSLVRAVGMERGFKATKCRKSELT